MVVFDRPPENAYDFTGSDQPVLLTRINKIIKIMANELFGNELFAKLSSFEQETLSGGWGPCQKNCLEAGGPAQGSSGWGTETRKRGEMLTFTLQSANWKQMGI